MKATAPPMKTQGSVRAQPSCVTLSGRGSPLKTPAAHTAWPAGVRLWSPAPALGVQPLLPCRGPAHDLGRVWAAAQGEAPGLELWVSEER